MGIVRVRSPFYSVELVRCTQYMLACQYFCAWVNTQFLDSISTHAVHYHPALLTIL